jgi:hypothetical protein
MAAAKKSCVSCKKQIPGAALDCVWCRARQPPPDLGDAEVLRDAVDHAKDVEAAGGDPFGEAASATERTLVGLKIADLTAAAAPGAKPVEATPVTAAAEPAPAKAKEPVAPAVATAAAAVAVVAAAASPSTAPARPAARAPEAPAVAVAVADGDRPWERLGRTLMGAGGALLIALFFVPWHGVSSWQLLETLSGADFVRQFFYLTGGLTLLVTSLLPLPFVFRAVVGAAVAALPVLLGAGGIVDGWRGALAAVALLGLPATHLCRSRAQGSAAARALVMAAVAAVVLLYLVPISSVVPLGAVLRLLVSGSVGGLVMGLLSLVPLGFAGLSLLGLMGRDLADVEVLLSVLIVGWAPAAVALRGLMIDDGSQLYVALALLGASATAVISLAQLLSLAARPRAA